MTVEEPAGDDQHQGSSSNDASTPQTPATEAKGDEVSQSDAPSESQNTDAKPEEADAKKEPPFAKGEINRIEPIVVGKKMVWKTDAKLYCPKNGYPHAIAQEFGLRKCPSCQQDLFRRYVAEEPDLDSKAMAERIASQVTHDVHIRDSDGYWLGSQVWPGKFDLTEARKGLPIAGHHGVLKVITDVRTSHRGDKHRGSYEARYIMDDGIFDNPSVGVRVHSTMVEITSPQFIRLLRGVSSYYPGLNLDGATLHLTEPYAVVAYHYKEIEAFQATYDESDSTSEEKESGSSLTNFPKRCDRETYLHVKTILGFIKENIWKDRITLEQSRHARPEPVCTYNMLWLLYEPGSTVYIESDGRLAAYIVQSVAADDAILTLPPERLKAYQVLVWYLDYDGRYIRRFTRHITIMPFAGEKSITSLSVIPCKFMDASDKGETRARLHSEGKRWYELLRGGLVRYTGDNLDTPRRLIDGRVVIDNESYHEQKRRERRRRKREIKKKKKDNSSDDDDEEDDKESREPELVDDLGVGSQKCPCEECMGLRPHPPQNFPWRIYDLIDPYNEKTLDLPDDFDDPKHRYLLCCKRLMGFVLQSRRWENLDVKNCKDPDINKAAIDMLVMPEERKKMIKALVHRFSTDSEGSQGANGLEKAWSADFIENKGEGKIFLLHGSPGVGKTYTAECIAEFTGRPLLSLTCGDLGNNETAVEKELSKWFKLAEKWGAVMLLDEADVYTEKRLVADLNRNSMVSVFLRCMEYYRGILFLTTNRVGHFDDAFVSRIHVVIHYKDLNHDDRKTIWNQFFDKLESDKRGIRVRKSARNYVLENPDMTKIGWNGREIRNAFQTAVALCEYEHKTQGEPGEAPALEMDHFEQVCDMALQFKKYLEEVHGADEAERAAKVRARARELGVSDY